MGVSTSLTAQLVADLVAANRVLRAPFYQQTLDDGVEFTEPEKGLQWGADVVPAMLDLFRVERDPREDHPDGWVGFARHWRGGTVRIGFDRFSASDDVDPVLVVTAIAGLAGTDRVEDEHLGAVDLPEVVPSQQEWEERTRRYQATRRGAPDDGSTAVSAWISALPGWKHDVAERFDEIVQREVADVRSAVRYHQPFYGVEGRGWFASFSAFSKHVKLSFVCGSYLEPQPPSGTGPTRQALDLTEVDELDEEQVASWVRQAAADPGMGW